jgi:glycosyltransferase involved in cell wall biosynthesis
LRPVLPRVSVITPAHNSAGTIAQTLRSVVAQTFGDWEAIVADDASSDDSAQLAASVDPRVKVVRSDANLGPAGARNLALEHATGELVAFLDADDRWLPEYLAKQVALFDEADAEPRHPRVGIVACDAWVERPDGTRIGRRSDEFGLPDGISLDDLLESNAIFISALCPRAAVDEVGGFSTECWGSEDHDLWLRLVERHYRVVVNAEPLAVYRVAGGSVSSSRLGMARTDAATYRRALERGNLSSRQARTARRKLRLARAAESVETRGAARSLPLVARAAVENPRLARGWLRRLAGR